MTGLLGPDGRENPRPPQAGPVNTVVLDPTDPTKAFIGEAAEPTLGVQTGPATLVNVHPATRCADEPCVIHHPSSHHMRGWPLNFRGDVGLMERLCEHGVGHPDPDALASHTRNGRAWKGVHGCDDCCRPT